MKKQKVAKKVSIDIITQYYSRNPRTSIMMKWFTSIAIVMGFAVDAGAASIAEFVSLHTGGAGRWTADYPGPDGYTIVCMRSVDQGREKRVIGWIPPNEKRLIIGLMLDENGN
ncbi:hypothetical protein, partial [Thiolapillus sp.]